MYDDATATPLERYLEARRVQAEIMAENEARLAQAIDAADRALVALSEAHAKPRPGQPPRPAGRVELATLTGEGESSIGQRLRRARTGAPRYRGGRRCY